jgi:hypothetical protein
MIEAFVISLVVLKVMGEAKAELPDGGPVALKIFAAIAQVVLIRIWVTLSTNRY